jgi:imidazolonepropionase-like amidohydrolase
VCSTARAALGFARTVAIRGDAIVRIAKSIDEPATRVIDAAGAIVSPGFIDTHTHARAGSPKRRRRRTTCDRA